MNIESHGDKPTPLDLQSAQDISGEKDPRLIGVVMLLKTSQIRFSQEPHRAQASYHDEDFEVLSQNVNAAGGVCEPIIVKELPQKTVDGQRQYEVIQGHRRLQACAENELDVMATVIKKPLGGQSFALDRLKGNRFRKELSPFEFGKQLEHIVDNEWTGSLTALGAAIGCSKSQVSRGLALATLPPKIISVINDPRCLRMKDGAALQDALKRDREIVLAEAAAIALLPNKLGAVEVVKRLLAAAGISGVARCNIPIDLVVHEQIVGNWCPQPGGETLIRICTPMSPVEQSQLMKKVQKVLSAYVQPCATATSTTKEKSNTTSAEAATAQL